jgi:hypothetical protein
MMGLLAVHYRYSFDNCRCAALALLHSKFVSYALVAGFTVLGITGCSAKDPGSPRQTLIEYGDGGLTFDGPITAEAAERFHAVSSAAPRGSTLRIRSAGGDAAASINIAEIVHEKKMNIEVFDYCMSGCAYIFIASQKKRVENNAIVVFHNTITVNNDIVSRSNLSSGQNLNDDVGIEEFNLFSDLGISPDILNKADAILEARCVGDRSKIFTASNRKLIPLGWNYHGWTLSLDQMEKMGIHNISGYWPASKNELDAVLKRHLKPGFLSRFVTDIDSIEDKNPALPPCF